MAVNAAGPGKPSEASRIVAAKPMFEAPKFLLDIDGKDIKIKAGEPLDINIPMVGTPTPTVEWTKDDAPVRQIPTITITSDDDHTQLLIPSSKRGDSGKYTISAKNEYGEANATVNVTVIDKPSAPEGPLEYPRVTKTSVQLQWKPPKDAGGTDITGKQSTPFLWLCPV